MYGSDLETKTTLEPFCFENTWVKHPDFIPRSVRFGEKILDIKFVWISGALRLTESKHFLRVWGKTLKAIIGNTSLFLKN